ncbi:MAG: hydrogenase [Desulfovibrio sp.]|nr:hydrogenase [Desulfovibrio sp.]
MSATRFVAHNGLEAFLAFLSQNAERVLAPTERPATAKPSVVFAPWRKGQPALLKKATVSPKWAVFPECEVLFRYRIGADGAGGRSLELSPDPAGSETIVFGGRPCDAGGFPALDRVYMQGLFKDPYYAARREKLTVITKTCNTGCQTCFCHWVGMGPTSPAGSDILMTEVVDGFVLQAITEKGRNLLAKSSLEDGGAKMPEVMERRKQTWAGLKPAPDISGSTEALKAIFADADFWTRQTDRCISCGACTYFCPTCYCFNITDEGEPKSENGGARLRSWDNCMSARYTREASGHNSRPLKSERMRNRVSHKFWTYPENWGAYLCTGCGRCIVNCPVNLDIREIVQAALAGAAGTARS